MNGTVIGLSLARGIIYHHRLVDTRQPAAQSGSGTLKDRSGKWKRQQRQALFQRKVPSNRKLVSTGGDSVIFYYVQRKENNLTVKCTLFNVSPNAVPHVR